MNKKTVEEIIDRFIRAVGLSEDWCRKSRIEKNPVYLGDILEKIKEKFGDKGKTGTITENASTATIFALMNRWCACGYDKSLQQIADDSVWDEDDKKAELKYKPAIELFKFLEKLNK